MDGIEPIYSVDASALIEMKDTYPYRRFRPMWDFLGGLGDGGRMLVTQPVRDECYDAIFKEWFNTHPGMVVPFSQELNAYVLALQDELDRNGLPLVDPGSTKNQGDPFVIALALMVEGRDVNELRTRSARTCHVVSYERRRKPGARLAKVTDVCDHYGLQCLRWLGVLEVEDWSL